MLKCKHQCHCACSSEIGTCIINDAGRQASHKKTTEIHVLTNNKLSKKIMTLYLIQ
jgi:hypothetical protein